MPAVAVTGLFCAGWVAGRGPLAARPLAGRRRDGRAHAGVPRGRGCSTAARWPSRSRSALAVLCGGRGRAAVARRPARATRRWRCSTRATSPARARRPTARSDINPLSIEPYFERAAIEDAAGNRRARVARARGRRAARAREPGGVAAARRVLRGQPRRARPRDPGAAGRRSTSTRPRPLNRSAYLVALRARNAADAEREAAARRARSRRAARRAAAADAKQAPEAPTTTPTP